MSGSVDSTGFGKQRLGVVTSQEKIWAIANSKPCVAVRYFYITEPEVVGGMISYEEKNLLNNFDAIRHSLVIK